MQVVMVMITISLAVTTAVYLILIILRINRYYFFKQYHIFHLCNDNVVCFL